MSDLQNIKIGDWNLLKIVKKTPFGMYLSPIEKANEEVIDHVTPTIENEDDDQRIDDLSNDEETEQAASPQVPTETKKERPLEILLPQKYIPEGTEVGSEINVFLYNDSEDRLIATTEKPMVKVGEFEVLEVVSISRVGTFLKWGLPKDLFLPFAEQTRNLKVGQTVVVALYLDKTQRICASMRIEKYLDKKFSDYKDGQKVELLIFGKTDLGYKAIVNNQNLGLLYMNQVFQDIYYGMKTPGFIQRVREDGKLDLILQQVGYKAADDIGEKILQRLKDNDGFLALTEKTPPEKIYEMFGVSKKKYKIALGGLYKKKLINIQDDGIHLGNPKAKK